MVVAIGDPHIFQEASIDVPGTHDEGTRIVCVGMSDFVYRLLDKGVIPDFIIRRAIRFLCRVRLREIDHGSLEKNHEAKMRWIEGVKARATIADVPEKANEQHYEVPTRFILSTLGPRAKYSSCLYPTGKETLEEAEVLMLESYCTKAQIHDGMDILDLGCGWGSVSLYLAEKYPSARITGLSNSATQKAYIDKVAVEKGFDNLTIITADVNTFEFPESTYFDRIISIEMFEHMKNYEALLQKVSSWLRPSVPPSNLDEKPPYTSPSEGTLASSGTQGKALLFVQVFCHRSTPYHFEEDDGWMAQNFFSGGTMPSFDLFLYFQKHATLLDSWFLPGTHYARTAEHWLKLQDANKSEGLSVLREDAIKNGKAASDGDILFNRFRVFYLAVAEFFNLDNGKQWGVAHYLFERAA